MNSMTTISTAAAARREAARHNNGEFGEHAHSAPELALGQSPWPEDLGRSDVSESGDWTPAKWGTVFVEYGARTPWGPAQQQEEIAHGIVFVPTDGHGGYKLSKERNAAIPRPMRNSSGWYEEDTERRLVEFYHFDAIRPNVTATERSERLAELDEGIRDWYPAQWEKVHGRELEPGESHVKDEQTWRDENADHYVVVAQQTIEDGLLLVTAERRSTGDRDQFVLSRSARDAAQDEALGEVGARGRFRVPAGVKPQKRPEPAPPKPAYTTVPDSTDMTVAAAKKLFADLDKRWRLSDGSVLTLRQQIQQGHITGKTVLVSDTGSRTFYLEDGGSGVMKVSKATFDAYEAPDRRTAKDRAREEWQVAQAKRDKAQRVVDGSWRPTQVQLQDLRGATAAANAAYKRYEETPAG